MAHMEAEMTGLQMWVVVETNHGTWFLPAYVVSVPDKVDLDTGKATGEWDHLRELLQYTEGTQIEDVDVKEGYGVRSSARGYMDQTDWVVYETEEEAQAAYEEERYMNGEIEEDEYDQGSEDDKEEDNDDGYSSQDVADEDFHRRNPHANDTEY